jgi:hypothetical protein
MSHEAEWRLVRPGSQVWRNGFAWLVISNDMPAGGTVALRSPSLDKEHRGSPPPYGKVFVLTPDDDRYRRSWAEETPPGVGAAEWAEALVIVRLGGVVECERLDGDKEWRVPSGLDDFRLRRHLLLMHDVITEPEDPVQVHASAESVVPHRHEPLDAPIRT